MTCTWEELKLLDSWLLCYSSTTTLCYDDTPPMETSIECYCDNARVILWLTNMQNRTIPCPNDTTNNDRDIFLEMYNTMIQCSPIQFSFIHVLGHQDKDPKHKLTTIEQFNVNCDAHAKWYVKAQTTLSTSMPTSELLASWPHLWLAGKTLCRNILPALRHAAATPAYRDYLCKKLLWKNGDANNIHWLVLQTALQLFCAQDQHWLVLFQW